MKEKHIKIWSALITAVVLLSIFAVLFIMNSKTPLYKDDYSYSYTFAVKENKFRITTVKELIDSQINHYKVMNGRIVPHTLAQAFLMLDKSIFNVINAAAFTLLVFLIYYLARGKSKSPAFLIAAFASLFLLTPRFGESFLWLTGACNYLWGMLLILLYLVPVIRTDSVSPIFPRAAGLILLGFLCGLTGENTASALIAMTVLFIVYLWVKNKRFNLPMFFGLIGNIIGFLVMLLAPGQSVRLSNNGGLGDIKIWLERIEPITEAFLEKLLPLVLITVVCLVISVILKRDRAQIIKTLIFFTGALVSVYSMVISPYFPDRVWSGPTILMTLTALSAISGVLSDEKKIATKVIAALLSLIMIVSVLYIIPGAVSTLSQISELDKARAEQIASAAERGDLSVTVDSIYGEGRFTCFDSFGDLNDDASTWPNTAIAMYFGIGEVLKTPS